MREKADVAIFVTLEPATKQMFQEAGAAGFYEIDYYRRVPRVQILTIAELLDGGKPELPAVAVLDTYRKPPTRHKGKEALQADLFKRGA